MSSILNDLLFKSRRMQNKLQDLERRLKQAERIENPLALLEPDIDFLISGAVINCKFRNMIDENEPDRNFQNDGRADFSVAAANKKRFCLLKFETPVQNVKAMSLRMITSPRIGFTIAEEGKFKSAEYRVSAVPTTKNWNPSDVTFNSYDPSDTIDIAYDVELAFSGNLINESGDILNENSIFNTDNQERTLSGIPFQKFDVGPFNGIEVRIQLKDFQSTLISDVFGQLQIDILDPIGIASSFVVTL